MTFSELEKMKYAGFNPCRVFTLAATAAGRFEAQSHFRSFNPCRVFTLAATDSAE